MGGVKMELHTLTLAHKAVILLASQFGRFIPVTHGTKDSASNTARLGVYKRENVLHIPSFEPIIYQLYPSSCTQCYVSAPIKEMWALLNHGFWMEQNYSY